MDAKHEADRLISERLDAVDRAAHRVACYEWPRFAITTALVDYVEGELVYEFTDLQPTYNEARLFVKRAFALALPLRRGEFMPWERREDFVIFNVNYYFTLLYVNLARNTKARFQKERICDMNTGFARFDATHNPPQLNADEQWLFKQGLVRGSDNKEWRKPRKFKFQSMGFGWRPDKDMC